MSHRSVFGLVTSWEQAEPIVRALQDVECPLADISLLGLDSPAPGGGFVTQINLAPLVLASVAPLLAAGPLAAALRAAKVDGVASGLIEAGIPSAEAGRYAASILAGRILVSMRTGNSDLGDRARQIFTTAQAGDIFTIAQVKTAQASLLQAHGILRRPAA